MKPKPLVKNAGKPKGFFGKLMIHAMNKEHTPLSLWGLDHLPEGQYRAALDIGCGGGVNLLRLSDFCNRVYGLDVSPLSVEESQKRCKKLIKNHLVRIELGSADHLPFPNDSFDLVTAFETIYFWPDLAACFAEVYRALRPGGIFLITNELKSDKDDPDKYAKLHEILELTVYDGEEMTAVLNSAGFADVTTHSEGEDWICAVARK
ncbi:MAG: class I SAM-dependent methyltransferase [Clostridia bacterium]|nr:class I SAM-dependent methyltransferase [Clostridia bacterium]